MGWREKITGGPTYHPFRLLLSNSNNSLDACGRQDIGAVERTLHAGRACVLQPQLFHHHLGDRRNGQMGLLGQLQASTLVLAVGDSLKALKT